MKASGRSKSKSTSSKASTSTPNYRDVALAIHGGAGVITRGSMTPAVEKQYVKKLEEALRKGWKLLDQGASALDGIEAAVKVLEDSPLFNAGRGSTFTHDGRIEMDSSIMSGSGKAAGAVAGVTTIKNPITAARAVMERSGHVLMIGHGAERFARANGITIVDPKYFWTKRQWDRLQQVLAEERESPVCTEKGAGASRNGTSQPKVAYLVAGGDNQPRKFGTVGAVARDLRGNLAAGTSTGGTLNKRFGRVGDSPIIGAGTYADNATCAISCTGYGEYFIRYVAAYDVSALMKYACKSLRDAAHHVVHATLEPNGGGGGLIALDARGNCALPFNTEGMYRGCITRSGKVFVAIYK